jgi:hypothetical protein
LRIVHLTLLALLVVACGGASAVREPSSASSKSSVPSEYSNGSATPGQLPSSNAGASPAAGSAQGMPMTESVQADSSRSAPAPAPAARSENDEVRVADSKKPNASSELQGEIETYNARALSLRAGNCAEACRALLSLERSVARLCSVEPPRCATVAEVAKRTHAQVIEACPACVP